MVGPIRRSRPRLGLLLRRGQKGFQLRLQPDQAFRLQGCLAGSDSESRRLDEGLESSPDTDVSAGGLEGSSREARLYEPRDPAHASYSMANLQRTQAFILAPVRTLASLMHGMGQEAIDLLKVDIEGAEYEVLDSLDCDGIYPRRPASNSITASRARHMASREEVTPDRLRACHG
jgi:hypothetical protein